MPIQSLALRQNPDDPNIRYLALTRAYNPSAGAIGYPEQYQLTAEQFAKFQNAGLTPETTRDPLYYGKGDFSENLLSNADYSHDVFSKYSTAAATGGKDLATDIAARQAWLDSAMGGKNNPLTKYGSLEAAAQANPNIKAAQAVKVQDGVVGGQVSAAGFQNTSSRSTAAGLSPDQIKQLDTASVRLYNGNFSPEDLKNVQFAMKNHAYKADQTLFGAPVAPPQTAPSSGIPTGGTAPTLPGSTATETASSFLSSVQSSVDTSRKTLENTYNKQIQDLKDQMATSQKKIDDLNSTEKGIIEGNVKQLEQPFREQLENAERQRLYINENFEANQKLTNELDSLLTQGNQLVEQQKNATGLAAIKNPRLTQTMSDVNARAGVIQAVLSARNGQIGQAYIMIDRTAAAITADRQDQLNYYSTILKFYDAQKGEEGQKLASLTAEQKKFLDAKIGLLQNDLQVAQTNAENLKKAMTNPDTALAYAQAGVTMNDSPLQINQKLAQYAYSKEVATQSKDMAEKGYTALLPGQSAPAGSEMYVVADSKGVQHGYYKQATAAKPIEVSPGATLYDPITKKPIYTAPTTKSQNGDGGVGSGVVKFSTDERQRLLATGVTNEDITYLQKYISENGFTDEVRSGIPKATATVLGNVLRGVTPTEEQTAGKVKENFLTKDFLKSLYTQEQLVEEVKKAGFNKLLKSRDQEIEDYLNHLMGIVNQYRSARFNDEEILKMMK